VKQFVFDGLVEDENICNLEAESKELLKRLQQGKNTILYAPRNYGKTSLIKNRILPQFGKLPKKSFPFFCDLMGVSDMQSIANRLSKALAQQMAISTPVGDIFEKTKMILTSLRPEVSVDPVSGLPQFSLQIQHMKPNTSIEEIFNALQRLAKTYRVAVVLDEFQDIAEVPEAQAVFRKIFQELRGVPIILMGSKQHLLSQLFAPPQAPLANFGMDLEIPPIEYDTYYRYMRERFAIHGFKINLPESTYLQNLMWRIPEPINMLCYHLLAQTKSKTITRERIHQGLKHCLDQRQSRFEFSLNQFSVNENKILVAISRIKLLPEPNAKSFLQMLNLTPRSVGQIVKKLYDDGTLEKTSEGYRIADPLMHYYLMEYR
jgi:hypothetical protein